MLKDKVEKKNKCKKQEEKNLSQHGNPQNSLPKL